MRSEWFSEREIVKTRYVWMRVWVCMYLKFQNVSSNITKEKKENPYTYNATLLILRHI